LKEAFRAARKTGWKAFTSKISSTRKGSKAFCTTTKRVFVQQAAMSAAHPLTPSFTSHFKNMKESTQVEHARLDALRFLLLPKRAAVRAEKQQEAERPFTMEELDKHWLTIATMKAAGPDGIFGEHLIELTFSLNASVLRLLQRCRHTGRMPKRWLQATLTPSSSPGSAPTGPSGTDRSRCCARLASCTRSWSTTAWSMCWTSSKCYRMRKEGSGVTAEQQTR